MRTVCGIVRRSQAKPILMLMLDESPTLDKNSKKLESFEQISMQIAGDGTKPKKRGVGVRWGLAGRILLGAGVPW